MKSCISSPTRELESLVLTGDQSSNTIYRKSVDISLNTDEDTKMYDCDGNENDDENHSLPGSPASSTAARIDKLSLGDEQLKNEYNRYHDSTNQLDQDRDDSCKQISEHCSEVRFADLPDSASPERSEKIKEMNNLIKEEGQILIKSKTAYERERLSEERKNQIKSYKHRELKEARAKRRLNREKGGFGSSGSNVIENGVDKNKKSNSGWRRMVRFAAVD